MVYERVDLDEPQGRGRQHLEEIAELDRHRRGEISLGGACTGKLERGYGAWDGAGGFHLQDPTLQHRFGDRRRYAVAGQAGHSCVRTGGVGVL